MREHHRVLSEVHKLVQDQVEETKFLVFRPAGESGIYDYRVGFIAIFCDAERISQGAMPLVFSSLDDAGATFFARPGTPIKPVLKLIETWGWGLPSWEDMVADLEEIGFSGGHQW